MTDALGAGSDTPARSSGSRDIGFAMSIVFILCIFFLPVPAFLLDAGLAISIGLSVLIIVLDAVE
jgi:flagellar biosynthesis protein FlhA